MRNYYLKLVEVNIIMLGRLGACDGATNIIYLLLFFRIYTLNLNYYNFKDRAYNGIF